MQTLLLSKLQGLPAMLSGLLCQQLQPFLQQKLIDTNRKGFIVNVSAQK
jgi:hypothetical protein